MTLRLWMQLPFQVGSKLFVMDALTECPGLRPTLARRPLWGGSDGPR